MIATFLHSGVGSESAPAWRPLLNTCLGSGVLGVPAAELVELEFEVDNVIVLGNINVYLLLLCFFVTMLHIWWLLDAGVFLNINLVLFLSFSQSTEGRQCNDPKIQYKICENPRCPPGVPDFRDWQCQTFTYHKQKHRWHAVISEGICEACSSKNHTWYIFHITFCLIWHHWNFTGTS